MKDKVAVIGCGLMGSSIVRTFAAAGERVTVWNRSRHRALRLESPSIQAVGDVQEAVDSAALVLLLVSNYEVAESLLDPVVGWDGTNVVNLVTGTPADAARFEEMITSHGAGYLDGAILAGPREIGTAEAMILFAGAGELWSAEEDRLRLLGGASRHVSDLASAANVLDAAATGAFYTVALGGLVEAAAYARASGVPPSSLLAPVEAMLQVLQASLVGAGEAFETNQHETDQATIDVFLEAAEGWLGSMVGSGQRAGLLRASVENMRVARDRGLGHLGFFAQVETAALSPGTFSDGV